MHVRVQVLSFILSSWRVPRPSYIFRRKFVRLGKGSFTEKVDIIISSSLCTARASTDSKLQYDPYYHLRGVFLDRVIHFGKNLGDLIEGRSPKKLKSLIRVPYVVHLKVQVLSFYVILILSPQGVPRPSYPFRG